MKLKTRKSALKRVKKRKNQLIHKKAFKGHLLRKKSSKRIRNLSIKRSINSSDLKTMVRMVPYLN